MLYLTWLASRNAFSLVAGMLHLLSFWTSMLVANGAQRLLPEPHCQRNRNRQQHQENQQQIFPIGHSAPRQPAALICADQQCWVARCAPVKPIPQVELQVLDSLTKALTNDSLRPEEKEDYD